MQINPCIRLGALDIVGTKKFSGSNGPSKGWGDVTGKSVGRQAAEAFEQYVSGGRKGPGCVFFIHSHEHVDAVASIVGPTDVMLVPDGVTLPAGVSAFTYTGSFLDAGDEMILADRHAFELQDYIASSFISILGLTVIQLSSAEGWNAFLQDADIAHEEGIFVEQLLHRAVLLDSSALFDGGTEVRPSLIRVHVAISGQFRDGPDGTLLGCVGDDRAQLSDTLAREGRGLDRIISRKNCAADLRLRPWLPRYVRAIEVLTHLDPVGSHTIVEGFGRGLIPHELGNEAGSALPVNAPMILTEGGRAVLLEQASGRRFALGTQAAQIAQALLLTGDTNTAALVFANISGLELDTSRDSTLIVYDGLRRSGIDLFAFGAVSS